MFLFLFLEKNNIKKSNSCRLWQTALGWSENQHTVTQLCQARVFMLCCDIPYSSNIYPGENISSNSRVSQTPQQVPAEANFTGFQEKATTTESFQTTREISFQSTSTPKQNRIIAVRTPKPRPCDLLTTPLLLWIDVLKRKLRKALLLISLHTKLPLCYFSERRMYFCQRKDTWKEEEGRHFVW